MGSFLKIDNKLRIFSPLYGSNQFEAVEQEEQKDGDSRKEEGYTKEWEEKQKEKQDQDKVGPNAVLLACVSSPQLGHFSSPSSSAALPSPAPAPSLSSSPTPA